MHKELFKFKDHDEEYCLSPVNNKIVFFVLINKDFSWILDS